jgi:hypothetical protein
MLLRGIAFVMNAMVFADDNPVVVGRIFHRGSSKAPQYFGEFLEKYDLLANAGYKKIVR